jgi:hypothetical protein
MPPFLNDQTGQVQRRSDGAYILFTAEGNCARDMDSAPNVCKITYEDWYATFGMPDRYTMAMRYEEFHTLTPGWSLMPTPCCKRDPQGLVLHEILAVWDPSDDASMNNIVLLIPRESKYVPLVARKSTRGEISCCSWVTGHKPGRQRS